jgi:hypothetical protein
MNTRRPSQKQKYAIATRKKRKQAKDRRVQHTENRQNIRRQIDQAAEQAAKRQARRTRQKEAEKRQA